MLVLMLAGLHESFATRYENIAHENLSYAVIRE